MRRDRLFYAALGAAVLCGGCKQADTTVATVTKVSVCETCEDKALEDRAMELRRVSVPGGFQNITLKPGEVKSMTNAMPTATASGAGATHLDAEVVDGELVFHADGDPAHVAKTQMGMMVEKSDGSAPQPVRVVATPEAASLLHQRAR